MKVTLHVSDGPSVHHQEFKTVHTASGICQTGTATCLLAATRWNWFHLMPASKQSSNVYDIYLMLCVQSWTPDDERKDRPKHVEWHSINSKIVHLVGFTVETCSTMLYFQMQYERGWVGGALIVFIAHALSYGYYSVH